MYPTAPTNRHPSAVSTHVEFAFWKMITTTAEKRLFGLLSGSVWTAQKKPTVRRYSAKPKHCVSFERVKWEKFSRIKKWWILERLTQLHNPVSITQELHHAVLPKRLRFRLTPPARHPMFIFKMTAGEVRAPSDSGRFHDLRQAAQNHQTRVTRRLLLCVTKSMFMKQFVYSFNSIISVLPTPPPSADLDTLFAKKSFHIPMMTVAF